MTPATHKSCLIRISAVLAALLGGCIDPSPYAVPDAGAPDTSTPDGTTDAEVDAGNACLACLQAPEDPGPGCKTNYDTCVADTKCDAILECVLAAGCLAITDMTTQFGCNYTCVVGPGGVVSQADPVLVKTQAVGDCAADGGACQTLCQVGP